MRDESNLNKMEKNASMCERWPKIADLPDILTPQMLTGVLHLSLNSIYQGLRNGSIPSARVGSRYIISKQAILQMFGHAAKDGEQS